MIEISIKELDSIIRAGEFKEWLSGEEDPFEFCLSGITREGFKLIYGPCGIEIKKESIVLKDSKVVKKMDALVEWIYRSYDNELHPYEEDAWEILELSGDDDVDYIGSYIAPLVSAIKFYQEAHQII